MLKICKEELMKASQSMFFVERDIRAAHALTANIAEEILLADLLKQAVDMKQKLDRLSA